MLHEVKSDYRDIAKFFPELKARLSPAEHKKQTLLDMARRGEARPLQKTKIGLALGNYTRRASQVYDPTFDRKIRKLAPGWFLDTVEENKRLLLKMAKAGKPKPKDKEKIGALLYLYLKKDRRFRAVVRRLAPHWLLKPADQKKLLLLEMAKAGKPKPKCPGTIARSLSNYTRKNSHCRDPIFASKIRKLRPDWF